MTLFISRLIVTIILFIIIAIIFYAGFLVWTKDVDIVTYVKNKIQSILPLKNKELEVLEVKPFVYIDERKDLQIKDWPAPMDLGIFFIVHLKNGTEHSAINGLKIKSSKYYLNFNQYIAHSNIDKIEEDWQEKKPYIIIDWDVFISEKNIKKTLYPNDEAYIGFTLLNPIVGGQGESGWKSPGEDYIGYENPLKKPKIPRKYPDFNLFFSDFNINNLPPKIIHENLEFFITINNKEIPIKRENISFVDKVNKHEYDTDSFEEMFLRYYAE